MTEHDESTSDHPEHDGDGEVGQTESGVPVADGPAARRSATLPIASLLVAIAVIAVAVGVWLLRWPPATPQEQRTSDRQDALITAERFGTTVTGFHAGRKTQYVDAVTDLLADGQDSPCWSTVVALVPAVADEAAARAAQEHEQVYDGSVNERAIEAIDSDSARALLVLDYSMEATVKDQRVPLAAQRLRMRLDLTKEGDEWLVNECTAVAPGAGDDE